MSSSVLGNLTLGFQQVWDIQRQPHAVLLFVDAPDPSAVDARHVLAMLDDAWSAQSPALFVVAQARPLLLDLLQHAPADGPCIVVEDTLEDQQVAEQVVLARQRGAQLAWRGAAARSPAHQDSPYVRRLLAIGSALPGMALTGNICASLARTAQAAACLDQAGAWGVAGWPAPDQAAGAAGARLNQPGRHTITALVKAIDDDASLEVVEHLLVQDPVLVYRFLLYTNSAALGLRNPPESLRHGLMLLGLSTLQRWLQQQMPEASDNLDHQPVRGAMVLHARLAEHLIDAGDEHDLRRALYLCALLSQIDRLLGEPLATALGRLHLTERILEALLQRSGPYAPYLEVAAALEYPRMGQVQELCAEHGLDRGDVNRALLRVLSHLGPASGRGR